MHLQQLILISWDPMFCTIFSYYARHIVSSLLDIVTCSSALNETKTSNTGFQYRSMHVCANIMAIQETTDKNVLFHLAM